MPRMQLKEESRLNGVKTNIRNLKDVSEALRVPGSAVIKFFCAEVGANQVMDTIIMGSHGLEHLEKLLDKFVMKYVLCSKCKYPELRMEVIKKDLWSTCNACGAKHKLDLTHKAGKQLFKDVPNFYKLCPEFQGKVSKNDVETTKGAEEGASRGGKRKRKGGAETE